MTTGEKIKNFRLINNLSQAKLGSMLGVSAVMISQYENGKRNPKYAMLCRIADCLNTDVSEILGDDVNIITGDVENPSDETYLQYRGAVEEWANLRGYDYLTLKENIYITTEAGHYEFTKDDIEMLQENINFYLDQELKKKRHKIIVPYRKPEYRADTAPEPTLAPPNPPDPQQKKD